MASTLARRLSAPASGSRSPSPSAARAARSSRTAPLARRLSAPASGSRSPSPSAARAARSSRTAPLARRLSAPAPGWTRDADIIVVGSGIAGLVVALRVRAHGRVLLVTKALLDDGSTRWAQGGIAAALAADDSPAE